MTSGGPRTEASDLRIVSWNILADEFFDPQTYQRVDAAVHDPLGRRRLTMDSLCSLALEYRPDVICLQEVAHPFQAALEAQDAKKILGLTPAQVARRQASDCLTLLAREERSDRVQVPHGGLVHLSTIGDRQPVVVVNAHLTYDADDRKAAQQVAAMLQVLDDNTPAIVVGDLNVSPDSRAFRRLLAVGFTPVRLDRQSFTANFPDAGPRHVDHILVRKATGRPLDIGARDILRLGPLPNALNPSDHIPIAANVRISP